MTGSQKQTNRYKQQQVVGLGVLCLPVSDVQQPCYAQRLNAMYNDLDAADWH
jgi:hypothetical protein